MADNDLTVGWIGAGRMGAAMAIRLARAGVAPTVWNRTRSKAEATVEHGCSVADEVADLRDRDVVFTMVSTPADLEQVLLGANGLLVDPDHLPGVVVDCSTVSTESSERIRQACVERGVQFLAAPVSGNAKVVKAGGLSLVVSGPEDPFHKVEHLLRFTPILLRKDFDLGLAAAHELNVPMPVAALTAQLVQQTVSSGRVTEDFAILLDQQAAASGLSLKPEDTPVDDGLSS